MKSQETPPAPGLACETPIIRLRNSLTKIIATPTKANKSFRQ
jgi:hypothetical protein